MVITKVYGEEMKVRYKYSKRDIIGVVKTIYFIEKGDWVEAKSRHKEDLFDAIPTINKVQNYDLKYYVDWGPDIGILMYHARDLEIINNKYKSIW